MAIDLLLVQTNPTTGAYEQNAARFLSWVERVQNSDRTVHELVVVPLGALEGALGLEALMSPEVNARLRDEVIKLGNTLLKTPNRSLLFCVGPQVFFTTNVPLNTDEAIQNGVLRLQDWTFAWGKAIPEGAIRLDFNRFTSAQARRVMAPGEPTVAVGMVGGLDEQVYAGDTGFFYGAYREALPAFREGAMRCRLERDRTLGVNVLEAPQVAAPALSSVSPLYDTLVVALADYVNKNHFKDVVLGVSGGIDSAVVLSLAVDALGAERVKAVLLPSRYTSETSFVGAEALLKAFGVRATTLSIEPLYETALETLAESLKDVPFGVTQENLQARLRGLLLMAEANRHQALLLCTSNKAEAAMGFGTLYGDLTGGFAPLIDLWKREVYALAEAKNAAAGRSMIPEVILQRAPSAELRENQLDSDSLPPYDTIETVMRAFLSHQRLDTIEGVPETEAKRIVRQSLRFAFKRAQGILGPIVSDCPLSSLRAFGVTHSADGGF